MRYLTDPKIDDLKKIVKQKYGVAAFIGAGCSSALRIPLWDDLLIGLNEEFKYYPDDDAVLNAITKDGYPKVASNIKSFSTNDKYLELVRKFTRPVACHFTSLHVELVKMSRTILTTNYDESFEETLNALGRFHDKSDWEFSAWSLGNFEHRGMGVERHIYHIHGASSTGDVVLTEESYFSQYEKPLSGVQNLIVAVFSNYTTVFVGFSFSDKDFINFLEKAVEAIKAERTGAGRDMQKHFCIMSDNLTKDYFTVRELKGDITTIEDWKSKGIIIRDDIKVPGETVFTFAIDASALIASAGLGDATEQYLSSLVRRLEDNKEKIALLSKLNIEPIYFEGNEYLQIEYILRKLNEPVASSSAAFTP
jgi:hypothetical protein